MSLFEQPLLILLSGLLIVTILVAIWSQTGKSSLLVAGAVALAATGGMLVVERWVETDRESVERTLREIAATVAAGDLEQLLQYAHSSAVAARRRAESEFQYYEIEEVRITQFWNVEVTSDVPPERAVAKFNVSVKGGRAASGFGVRRVVRYVIVTLEKENGDWKVVSYEHDDPRRPLLRSGDN
jgi:hypothetical protein